jgi:murein DD-endopeptidase MepM/ murein hydrolase activator NlpD
MLKNIKRPLIVITVILGLAALAYFYFRPALMDGNYPRPLYSAVAADSTQTPAPFAQELSIEEEDVRKAINQAIADRSEMVLAYLLYDIQVEDVRIAEDESYASAWLVMRQHDTGDPLPSEPGIAFTLLERGRWRAVLPGDLDWLETLENAPDEILSQDAKAEWLLKSAELTVDLPSAPLGGYLLPWAAGKVVSLSQSVSHDRYTPSGTAHYAFDFYISRTMWEIHAAKAGTVWMWKDDVPNDDNGGAGNYIVLQDTTTTPVTYQLYLHLAQNSIPTGLKIRGAPVMQGQFIGIADNTGQSTGHHLHFHVHTVPTSYWGQSVDITFNDVPINGGRPRRIDSYINELPYCQPSDVCLQGQQSYVSGNIVQGDSVPPLGDIINITTGQVVTTSDLLIAGWGQDVGSGLKSIQMIAKYDGGWREVSPVFAVSPVVYEWDMCAGEVPDGPVSVALHLIDWHGNQTQLAGLKHFTKSFACPPPPPACIPGPDQVALFSQPNFEGECAVFNAGDYENTGAFPDNQAASLQVGANMWVTLFAGSSYRDRSETFLTGDSNLVDNRVGLNSASSLQVKNRSTLPSIPLLVWPTAGSTIPASTSTTLFWEDPGGAAEFQIRLSGALALTSEWQVEPYWHLGGLPQGSYTWQVRARNIAGESGWSGLRTLSVSAGGLLDEPGVSLPYDYDVENASANWTSSGLWQRVNSEVGAHSGQFFWRYGEDVNDLPSYNRIRSGDLTSPPISIPALGTGSIERPYLRFWSRYDTETQGRHWDQRWVQVSAQGEPFQDLLQLTDDPMNYWVQSPFIDLSAFAGQDIRIRFYFTSLDEIGNNYQGWFIDDVHISLASLPACTSLGQQSGGAAGAAALAYGDQISGEICPPGDVDHYRFSGQAGDRIVVDIDAHSIGSDLDAILYLLDSDGASPLAFHDDEVIGMLFDPHLGYRLPWDGDFYLKLLAWDHPGAGGSRHMYDLSLFTDAISPEAEIGYPISGASVPVQLTVQAIAADEGSGISHVEFYWHSADWLNSDWVNIGSDWSGEDGWRIPFTASEEQVGAAFYIRVYDWAGNWTGAGAWDLNISQTPGMPVFLPLIPR